MSKTCLVCSEKLREDSKFCGHCGSPVGASQPVVAAQVSGSPLPFLVNPTKVVVLSFFSFGLYDIYWLMKQWRYVKVRDQINIRPFWRALFSILFANSLFKKLGTPQPGRQAALYILFSLAGRLPGNWWLISVLSVIPLFQVQQDLNIMHNAQQLSGYSKKELAMAIFGGLFWLVVLWAFTQA